MHIQVIIEKKTSIIGPRTQSHIFHHLTYEVPGETHNMMVYLGGIPGQAIRTGTLPKEDETSKFFQL